MPPIKVASIQVASIPYNLLDTLLKLSTYAGQASQHGAKLVVFPEAFLSGYPRRLGFQIGNRTAEDREWFKKYVASSIMIPEKCIGKDLLADGEVGKEFGAFREICNIARDNEVYLSVGIIERTIVGSTLYCSNILISPKGILLSLHRKLQPTACERVVWSQGQAWNTEQDSTNLPVVPTSLGKMGGLICWENFMPLPRYSLYQKGVEMWVPLFSTAPSYAHQKLGPTKFDLAMYSYLAPTADGRPTWLPTMQHIAQEGRCFVISANQFHKSSDFPTGYPGLKDEEEKNQVWCRGGSCIIDPLGNVLAGPLWDEEGIILADIDVDELHGARLDFDPVGHYSRSDMFEFAVPGDKAKRR